MGLGLKVHVGHVLGLEHDLGLGVDPSYKPCWDHITQPLPPHERTMSELTTTEFTYDSLCIQYTEEDVPYMLKTGIHLLPKFHGLAGEDPCKHLKQFHVVCSTMKPIDVQEDHVYLKAFPHSLEGNAKYWLYYLAPRSITSWDDLKRLFLAKFFPTTRTTVIRKEISGIKQQSRETLYEYWERFKNFCSSCPHHQISEHMLLQYFYEGLHHVGRNRIDAASGGALGNMTLAASRQLIENMASNSQQFGTRSDAIVVRGVHDVGAAKYTMKLESKIDALLLFTAVVSFPSISCTSAAPSIPLPFPLRVIPSKKMEEVDREILETFRKVEVSIPLLDAIKQIPKYAKFLKELCTHKRRLK